MPCYDADNDPSTNLVRIELSVLSPGENFTSRKSLTHDLASSSGANARWRRQVKSLEEDLKVASGHIEFLKRPVLLEYAAITDTEGKCGVGYYTESRTFKIQITEILKQIWSAVLGHTAGSWHIYEVEEMLISEIKRMVYFEPRLLLTDEQLRSALNHLWDRNECSHWTDVTIDVGL